MSILHLRPLRTITFWGLIFVATVSGFTFTDTYEKSFVPTAESPLVQSIQQSLRRPFHSFLEATITTDKDDYNPGEIALITGSGFAPGETVTLQVVHTDAPKGSDSLTAHEGHDPWNVSADAAGNVSASWLVGEDSLDQWLLLTAYGNASGLRAEHLFTDASGVDFSQSANNDTINGETPSLQLGRCHWIGSIVQQSNARYFEGMSNMQRVVLFNFDPTDDNVHRLTFDHDWTKGGIHAYDFLTSWEQAIAAAPLAAQYTDVTGTTVLGPGEIHSASLSDARACGVEIGPPGSLGATCLALRGAGGFQYNVELPDDPFIDPNDGSTLARIQRYEALYGNRYLRVYANAPIISANIQFLGPNGGHDGLSTGDSQVHYILTVVSTGTVGLVEVAGHLAKSGAFADDNLNWGVGQGSSQISGGPYHFNLRRFGTDIEGNGGDSLGAQDNQIKGADIQLPQGTITIIKDADPNDVQDFSFTTTGTGLSNFLLDDDAGAPGGDATLSTTKQFTNLGPGNYTVTEGAVSGWTLTGLVCNDPTGGTSTAGSVATINISAGEDVVCTYTNTKNGSITIIKNTVGGNDTFGYTGSGGAPVGNFNITTVAGTGTQQFNDVTPGGPYTVAENAPPAGWQFTNLVCGAGGVVTLATRTATITVPAGGNVTCTYTNTKNASITIIKNTVGGNDTFGYTGSGGAPVGNFNITTVAGTGTQQIDNVTPGGPYTISENAPPAGWQFTNLTCGAGGVVTLATRTATITVPAGGNVTCTYTNTKNASITIIKNTVGGNDTFGYTGSGGAPVGNFNITTVAGTGTQQIDNVTPGGPYTISENAPPAGWQFTNLVCGAGGVVTLATRTATITVPAGGNVTCTYTNTKNASITIIKNTVGGNDTFGYTGAGGAPVGNFSILTVAGTGTQQFDNVTPGGPYTIVENAPPAGWQFTNLVCSAGGVVTLATRTATITVPAGGNVTCTYTNTKQGSITIVKNTVGGNDTFNYTGAGGAPVGNFSILTAAGTGSQQFNNVPPGGPYTIVESALPAGWQFTNLTCGAGGVVTLATRTATITVPAGGNVTCTYTNTKQGSITIVKNTVGGNDTFNYTGAGGAPVGNFSILTAAGTGSQQFNNVPPGGPYTVVESALPAGWQFTNLTCGAGGSVDLATRTATITVPAGGNVTCTYTNTKQGSITIVKNTVGGNDTFNYTGAGGAPVGNFSILTAAGTGSQQFNNVPPGGPYTIVESALPAGWQFTNLTCGAGGVVTLATRTATITVPAGGNVTCTYTNTKQGSITIVKNTVGGNDTFNYTGAGGAPVGNFSILTAAGTGSQQFNNVPPGGPYTIVESALPAGWQFTNLTCGAGGSVDLATRTATITVPAGGNVTCTYTNTKSGSITIVKNTVGGNDTFNYTGAGGAPVGNFSILTAAGTGSQQFNNVPPGGPYTIVESALPAGWQFTNLTCGAGGVVTLATRTATITVPAGGNVTCTYTNTKQGAIKIVKNTVGGDRAFTFNPTGFNANAPFDLTTVAGTAMTTFVNIAPGSGFSVSETVPAGWDLTSFVCDNGGTPAAFAVLPGTTTTCTATNKKLPTLIVRKVIQGQSQQFSFVVSGSPTNPPNTNINLTPAANSEASSSSQVIQPGNYSVTETPIPPGWMLTDASCESDQGPFDTDNTGLPIVTFVAGYGDDVVCSYFDLQAGGATRTQGFWSTHTVLTDAIWNGTALPPGTSTINPVPVIGSPDAYLCKPPTIIPDFPGIEITAIPAAGQNQVLGGFWANISKKLVGGRRTALEQARMQFLQQYLAAVLNVHAFGTPIGTTTLANARSFYCGSDPDAIRGQMSLLAAYNEMGDTVEFTPGVNATAKLSRNEANILFWDITFR